MRHSSLPLVPNFPSIKFATEKPKYLPIRIKGEKKEKKNLPLTGLTATIFSQVRLTSLYLFLHSICSFQ